MVEMYPTPMSLMWTHLDKGNVKVVQSDFFNVFKNNQPIQGELLQVCEVTSDVLKSSVGDSWTPRYVKAHLGLYPIS